jgi:hypothetical protein
MKTATIVSHLVLLLGLSACDDATEKQCAPGATQVCYCTATSQGVQTCQADGSGWSTCLQCTPGSDTGVPAADAPAGSDRGVPDLDAGPKADTTPALGELGDPCKSSAACGSSSEGKLVCKTQIATPSGDFTMVEWKSGYCTISCDKNSTCPSGSLCDNDVCMNGCGSQADCRVGYLCGINGHCEVDKIAVPKACSPDCDGCCINGQCVQGDQSSACGSAGQKCRQCAAQEKCSGGTAAQCVCKGDCGAGCCDAAGACQPGTSKTVCGTINRACEDCGTGTCIEFGVWKCGA